MTRPIVAACALVALAALSSCSGTTETEADAGLGDSTNATVPTAAERPSWDAVVESGAVTVVTNEDPALGWSQAIELTDVDPQVSLFADRPTRLAGDMDLRELLALWYGGAFGSDPPNAAVVIDGSTTAVELDAAVYDPANRRIAFKVDRLDDVDGAPGPSIPVGAHGRTALFIDAFAGGPIASGDSPIPPTVKVLGDAPAMAMGQLYQTVATSLGLLAENATAPTAPESMYAQETTDQSVSLLYAIDSTGCAPGQEPCVAIPTPGS